MHDEFYRASHSHLSRHTQIKTLRAEVVENTIDVKRQVTGIESPDSRWKTLANTGLGPALFRNASPTKKPFWFFNYINPMLEILLRSTFSRSRIFHRVTAPEFKWSRDNIEVAKVLQGLQLHILRQEVVFFGEGS